MTDHLTAFSWGYEGWGSAPEKFVEAADAVEASRGFGPPMFVDVRFKRSGRAPGFKEKAFEKLLGPERYRWMKGLGNAAIGEERKTIRIHDPEAAEGLLELIQRAGRDGRRVLFFCGCLYPGTSAEPICHRVRVGDLLLEAAQRRGLALTVVEWPGGEPEYREFRCESAAVARVLRGVLHIDLPDTLPLAEAASFAFGTRLLLRGPQDACMVAVSSAVFRAGKWQLPRLLGSTSLEETFAEEIEENRRVGGLIARSTGGTPTGR